MFKVITGFSNYSVSVEGVVINNKINKILKNKRTAHGYLVVTLYPNKEEGVKPKTCRVHRLVAQEFIPNPEDKPDVNHKDRDKENNHVGNLEWIDKLENDLHAKTTGERQSYIGARYNGQFHSKAKMFLITSPEGVDFKVYGYSELEKFFNRGRSFIFKSLKKSNYFLNHKVVEVQRNETETQNLSHHVVLRLNSEENEALNQLSKRKEKPKSYFLRLALISILKEEALK